MEYKGDEDEVVSKMVQMEEQDMEIAGDMGLGKKEKRRQAKKIIRDRKVDFVLLQESKMENVNRGMVRQLWKDDNFDFVEMGADGSAGGSIPGLTHKKERSGAELIDFLIHPEWLEIFNFKQWGLPRSLSDHSPIILMEDLRDWGPRPFKFINAWVLHPKCLQVMESAWMQSDVQGWAGYRIMRKLKGMKEALKEWNRVYFRKCPNTDRASGKATTDLDIKAKEGQRRNALNSVTVNGQVFDEPNIVKEEVKVYFQNLFFEDWEIRPQIGGSLENTISAEEAEVLLKEFSEKEVRSAIMSCDGNKAPGPDVGITVKRNGFVPMVEKLEIQGYKKANLGMLAVGGYLDCLAY
ncbi:hypothetical protein Acr_25g0006280 [Actinidia rufa]|uniref:DNAse I-like superfamily protein n=1 Tax=Actinidia rufa TaxID=165716 RepID=A0A7J0GZH1_9ERIC|nr:hypothetical protein Acr_25g0006280 [Actinidia rufa]